jgi:hypothetical protein
MDQKFLQVDSLDSTKAKNVFKSSKIIDKRSDRFTANTIGDLKSTDKSETAVLKIPSEQNSPRN